MAETEAPEKWYDVQVFGIWEGYRPVLIRELSTSLEIRDDQPKKGSAAFWNGLLVAGHNCKSFGQTVQISGKQNPQLQGMAAHVTHL